jgi:hypothetical protein
VSEKKFTAMPEDFVLVKGSIDAPQDPIVLPDGRRLRIMKWQPRLHYEEVVSVEAEFILEMPINDAPSE